MSEDREPFDDEDDDSVWIGGIICLLIFVILAAWLGEMRSGQ